METRLEPIQKNDVNSKQILRAALVVLACMNLQFGLEQNQPQSLLHDQWWCNLLTTKMLLIKKPYFLCNCCTSPFIPASPDNSGYMDSYCPHYPQYAPSTVSF